MKKAFVLSLINLLLVCLAILVCACDNQEKETGSLVANKENANDLAAYKEAAKANLTAYVDALSPDDYSYYNWLAIKNIADTGKENIDKATDKQGVDSALAAAKEEIGIIDKVNAIQELKLGVYITEESKKYAGLFFPSIILLDGNRYIFERSPTLSSIITGNYKIIDNELILYINPRGDNFILEIINKYLVLLDGPFNKMVLEPFVEVGTIFKLLEEEEN